VRSIDRRLIRSGRAARTQMLVAVALGLVATLALVAQAVLLAQVVSRAFLDGAALADLTPQLIALVAVASVRAAVSWAFEVSGRLGAARAMSDLRGQFVERVARSRPAGLTGERSGEIAAAAVQGVDALEAYFARYLPQLVLSALAPVVALAWVVHVDVVAAAILAGTLPLIPLFMVLIGRMSERRAAARFAALSRLSGHFLDVVRGLPTLRAFGRAEAQASVLAQAGDRYRRETMGTLRIAFLSALVLELLAMLGTAMVAVVLGVRLAHGGLALEDALTVLILAPEIYAPLRQLGAQYHAATDGLAAAQRIFEIVDAPPAIAVPADPVALPAVRAATVRFEAVGFSYPARAGSALEGIDLDLAGGECVALVGRSGAGKSTIASLLLRLVDPTEGRVTVAGHDLRDLDPDAWRARLAWLPQRPHVFAATVADNIRLADPTASELRVQAAAAAAGACFVDLETRIGEGGHALSAGEARRIALARAFLRDAPILVLDEPTAHLDADNAALIADAIVRLVRDRTTLLITHDPGLAARADTVVAIEGGRIAAGAAAPREAGPVPPARRAA
jgi:ATP-binding cassette, subfamily C, bacterial CydD